MNKLSTYDKLTILLTATCICMFANDYYQKKIQPKNNIQNIIQKYNKDSENNDLDCNKPCLERPVKCRKTEIDGLPVLRLSGYVNNLRTTNAYGIYAQLYNQYNCSYHEQKHYIWDEQTEKFVELNGTYYVKKDDIKSKKIYKNHEIRYKGKIYKIQDEKHLINDKSKIIFP